MSLALIAGAGDLPSVIAEAAANDERAFRLCELKDFPSSVTGAGVATTFRIEHLGSFISRLKEDGVTQACFAGSIARPSLDPAEIDAQTMPLVPRMMTALQSGDDAALRLVLSFFEDAGIGIVAAHDLVPRLLPPSGVLSAEQPSTSDEKNADRGLAVIDAMASVDLGQACIISNGQALAVEAIGGTDWMMRSLLQRDPALPDGGILVKAAKKGQDMRIDAPTIGPDTFRRAEEIGLRGVVIEAGSVLVLHLDHCIEQADRAGLLFWVRP